MAQVLRCYAHGWWLVGLSMMGLMRDSVCTYLVHCNHTHFYDDAVGAAQLLMLRAQTEFRMAVVGTGWVPSSGDVLLSGVGLLYSKVVAGVFPSSTCNGEHPPIFHFSYIISYLLFRLDPVI